MTAAPMTPFNSNGQHFIAPDGSKMELDNINAILYPQTELTSEIGLSLLDKATSFSEGRSLTPIPPTMSSGHVDGFSDSPEFSDPLLVEPSQVEDISNVLTPPGANGQFMPFLKTMELVKFPFQGLFPENLGIPSFPSWPIRQIWGHHLL
jgi:hypothetical protein